MSDSHRELADLLASARNGLPEAIGEAFEACRPYLLTVAGRELDPALKAKGGASDLVQQTFLEAQRDFAGFDGESEAELLAWLRRVLLNNVANFARSYRETAKRDVAREQTLQPRDSSLARRGGLLADTTTPSGIAVQAERFLAVQQAIDRLPDDYQQVLLLRYREERSFEEIGRRLNRSSNAARKLWSRAVERLQKELEQEGSET